ncbi:Cro/Cl family transcriptional regulator [Curtobacterium sp. MCPF17_047]|uniref:helix-turn-helix domain-containing protein n=1 Tax=Curtobacterium sp. MCPF17_047 TaxID=2175654 RepID=UPI000DA9FB6D|nr:XRE family transcriptional regulator [Curtobacterium sp. MCPF17_047]PZF68951.1 Cro/Cl family transcriptional regulator [Curtobacterium sp. MCPF17_047]
MLHSVECTIVHANSNEAAGVLAHVSENVRRYRSAANMSQLALAERAGISRRTVIKLESGEANISLLGLDHLAEALGVTFVDLVAAPAAQHTDINEVTWRGNGPTSAATLLASVPASKNVQLWFWVLEPRDRYNAETDPEGWSEMILVIEGSVRVEFESGTTELHAGDHLAFPTSQRYSYFNAGPALVRFVRVVATQK